ncbi:Cell wall protein PGA48 [Spathaspora sp. JA1]|nr:Cell wall protein PGA48 [Spathaspora sp. JA1]
MQFSKVIVPSALIAAAAAGNVTVTTEVVVTDFTTYCPLATTLVVNNKTITVTEATTLTITGPCTLPTTYVTSAAAPTTAPSNVTTIENGAGKVAAGAVAGFAAIAAVLL